MTYVLFDWFTGLVWNGSPDNKTAWTAERRSAHPIAESRVKDLRGDFDARGLSDRFAFFPYPGKR